MQGGQKAALAVVLILIVVGVVAYFLVGMGGEGPPAEQRENFAKRQVEKIDEQTYETIAMTMDEWEELGKEKVGRVNKYKNPKTGKFTMVAIDQDTLQEDGVKIPFLDEGDERVPEGVREESVKKAKELQGDKGGEE